MANYTNITSFQDYLQTLAVSHSELLHGVDGRVSFVRYRSKEDLQQLTKNGAINSVAVSRIYGRGMGHYNEQRMKQFWAIRFMSYAADQSLDAAPRRELALDTAWQIMFDFVARIRKDVDADSCHALKNIELENLSWEEIPGQPILIDHYGWDLTIPFKSYMPGYDPDRWV